MPRRTSRHEPVFGDGARSAHFCLSSHPKRPTHTSGLPKQRSATITMLRFEYFLPFLLLFPAARAQPVFRVLSADEKARFVEAKTEAEQHIKEYVDHMGLTSASYRVEDEFTPLIEEDGSLRLRIWDLHLEDAAGPKRTTAREAVRDAWTRSLKSHGFENPRITIDLPFSGYALPDWSHSVRLVSIVQKSPSKPSVFPVHLSLPEYPLNDVAAGIFGEVLLEFRVGADGRPDRLSVLNATGKHFSLAAREAVAQWRFSRYPHALQIAGEVVFQVEFAFRCGADDEEPNKAAEPSRTTVTPPAGAGDRASGARGSP